MLLTCISERAQKGKRPRFENSLRKRQQPALAYVPPTDVFEAFDVLPDFLPVDFYHLD